MARIKVVKGNTGKHDLQQPTEDSDGREHPNLSLREEVNYILFMDFYMERVDWPRLAVWRARKEDRDAVLFELGEGFPRDLWLRLLSHSLLGYFDTDVEECLALFAGKAQVLLTWEKSEEDEKEQMLVFADDTYVGQDDFDDFFTCWEAESLRWLIEELGITPKQLRSTFSWLSSD